MHVRRSNSKGLLKEMVGLKLSGLMGERFVYARASPHSECLVARIMASLRVVIGTEQPFLCEETS